MAPGVRLTLGSMDTGDDSRTVRWDGFHNARPRRAARGALGREDDWDAVTYLESRGTTAREIIVALRRELDAPAYLAAAGMSPADIGALRRLSG